MTAQFKQLLQKIDMTSPVGQQVNGSCSEFYDACYLLLETLPQPKDRGDSAKCPLDTQAVRYSALWSEKACAQSARMRG
jgi:hypothetical protein